MADTTLQDPQQPQGAAEATVEPQGTAGQENAPETPATGDDAGKGGKDAVLADLARERDKRQTLEQQLEQAQQTQQAQLDAIAKALGLKQDEATDPAKLTEQLTAAQAARAEADAKLLRLEVAVEKAVPAHLVGYVTGSTREEIDTSVTKVLADFSAALDAANAPRTPRPDPSQGPQGTPTSLGEQIAQAEKDGDIKRVMALKARQLVQPG